MAWRMDAIDFTVAASAASWSATLRAASTM